MKSKRTPKDAVIAVPAEPADFLNRRKVKHRQPYVTPEGLSVNLNVPGPLDDAAPAKKPASAPAH